MVVDQEGADFDSKVADAVKLDFIGNEYYNYAQKLSNAQHDDVSLTVNTETKFQEDSAYVKPDNKVHYYDKADDVLGAEHLNEISETIVGQISDQFAADGYVVADFASIKNSVANKGVISHDKNQASDLVISFQTYFTRTGETEPLFYVFVNLTFGGKNLAEDSILQAPVPVEDIYQYEFNISYNVYNTYALYSDNLDMTNRIEDHGKNTFTLQDMSLEEVTTYVYTNAAGEEQIDHVYQFQYSVVGSEYTTYYRFNAILDNTYAADSGIRLVTATNNSGTITLDELGDSVEAHDEEELLFELKKIRVVYMPTFSYLSEDASTYTFYLIDTLNTTESSVIYYSYNFSKTATTFSFNSTNMKAYQYVGGTSSELGYVDGSEDFTHMQNYIQEHFNVKTYDVFMNRMHEHHVEKYNDSTYYTITFSNHGDTFLFTAENVYTMDGEESVYDPVRFLKNYKTGSINGATYNKAKQSTEIDAAIQKLIESPISVVFCRDEMTTSTFPIDFRFNIWTKSEGLDFIFRLKMGYATGQINDDFSNNVVLTIDKGAFATDYNFNGQVKLGNVYLITEFNWIVLIFAIILIFNILGKAVWGLIKRIYEITLLFLVMPGVASLMPLDPKGSKFGKWKDKMINQVLGAYGVTIGLNFFFIMIPVIRDASAIFTDADVMNMTPALQWFVHDAARLNFITYILFLLVALTLLKTVPGLISQFVGGADMLKQGEETFSNVTKTASEATKAISGKQALESWNNVKTIASPLKTIPGSEIYKEIKKKQADKKKKKDEERNQQNIAAAGQDADNRQDEANKLMEAANNMGENPPVVPVVVPDEEPVAPVVEKPNDADDKAEVPKADTKIEEEDDADKLAEAAKKAKGLTDEAKDEVVDEISAELENKDQDADKLAEAIAAADKSAKEAAESAKLAAHSVEEVDTQIKGLHEEFDKSLETSAKNVEKTGEDVQRASQYAEASKLYAETADLRAQVASGNVKHDYVAEMEAAEAQRKAEEKEARKHARSKVGKAENAVAEVQDEINKQIELATEGIGKKSKALTDEQIDAYNKRHEKDEGFIALKKKGEEGYNSKQQKALRDKARQEQYTLQLAEKLHKAQGVLSDAELGIYRGLGGWVRRTFGSGRKTQEQRDKDFNKLKAAQATQSAAAEDEQKVKKLLENFDINKIITEGDANEWLAKLQQTKAGAKASKMYEKYMKKHAPSGTPEERSKHIQKALQYAVAKTQSKAARTLKNANSKVDDAEAAVMEERQGALHFVRVHAGNAVNFVASKGSAVFSKVIGADRAKISAIKKEKRLAAELALAEEAYNSIKDLKLESLDRNEARKIKAKFEKNKYFAARFKKLYDQELAKIEASTGTEEKRVAPAVQAALRIIQTEAQNRLLKAKGQFTKFKGSQETVDSTKNKKPKGTAKTQKTKKSSKKKETTAAPVQEVKPAVKTIPSEKIQEEQPPKKSKRQVRKEAKIAEATELQRLRKVSGLDKMLADKLGVLTAKRTAAEEQREKLIKDTLDKNINRTVEKLRSRLDGKVGIYKDELRRKEVEGLIKKLQEGKLSAEDEKRLNFYTNWSAFARKVKMQRSQKNAQQLQQRQQLRKTIDESNAKIRKAMLDAASKSMKDNGVDKATIEKMIQRINQQSGLTKELVARQIRESINKAIKDKQPIALSKGPEAKRAMQEIKQLKETLLKLRSQDNYQKRNIKKIQEASRKMSKQLKNQKSKSALSQATNVKNSFGDGASGGDNKNDNNG